MRHPWPQPRRLPPPGHLFPARPHPSAAHLAPAASAPTAWPPLSGAPAPARTPSPSRVTSTGCRPPCSAPAPRPYLGRPPQPLDRAQVRRDSVHRSCTDGPHDYSPRALSRWSMPDRHFVYGLSVPRRLERSRDAQSRRGFAVALGPRSLAPAARVTIRSSLDGRHSPPLGGWPLPITCWPLALGSGGQARIGVCRFGWPALPGRPAPPQYLGRPAQPLDRAQVRRGIVHRSCIDRTHDYSPRALSRWQMRADRHLVHGLSVPRRLEHSRDAQSRHGFAADLRPRSLVPALGSSPDRRLTAAGLLHSAGDFG